MRPFEMERWQSHYENEVRYNLSESGVHPVTLGELLDLAGPGASVEETLLGYGHTRGTEELRERIAALHPQASPDQVLGDAVAVLTPTYMQLPGLADGLGAEVRYVALREEDGWQPDPREVGRAIGHDTRMVVVTNPQNPTGARLTDTSIAAVLGAAERVGAWVLADEVYAGAEREGSRTPSLFGRYERVISTGSLSKAYGLPGLRLGWVVTPSELTESVWARKDYTTIAPGPLTDSLATLALRPDVRDRLIERARGIVRDGLAVVEAWARESGVFRVRGHEAGAVCFPSYDLPIDSMALAERLRVEKDVLIVPGSQFEMGRYVRIGFGIPRRELEEALGRVTELTTELRTGRT